MKTSMLILTGSLLINGALFAGWRYRTHLGEQALTSAAKPTTVAAVGDEKGLGNLDGTTLWAKLNDCPDNELASRLRAEGFPENVVRNLVVARLNARYAERRKALTPEKVVVYWRDNDASGLSQPVDPKLRAQRRALELEYSKELRALLGGEDSLGSDYQVAELRRTYGNLAPEKIQQITAINRDYNELRSQISAEMRGIKFPEDIEKMNFLESERRADLVQALTPEELEAYDLRASDVARGLRSQLAAFDPSEDEYKAIFRAQQAYEKQHGSERLTADEARDLREAEVRAALSPERFADYQVTTSGSYSTVKDLVARLSLPNEAVGQVIMLQRDIVSRANGVRADPNLTNDQRNLQLSALVEEATGKLTTTLGAAGADQYKMIAGGAWLQLLKSSR